MYDYNIEAAPWYEKRNSISEIDVIGVSSIGQRAFYGLDRVRYVYISDDVLSIADNAFVGHSPNMLVFSDCFSFSELGAPTYIYEYAKEHDLKYRPMHIFLEDCEVTIPQDTYEYTGREIKPKVTVKYKDIFFEENLDYNVVYGNNIMPGEADISISRLDNPQLISSTHKNFTILPTDDMETGEDTVTTDDMDTTTTDDMEKSEEKGLKGIRTLTAR